MRKSSTYSQEQHLIAFDLVVKARIHFRLLQSKFFEGHIQLLILYSTGLFSGLFSRHTFDTEPLRLFHVQLVTESTLQECVYSVASICSMSKLYFSAIAIRYQIVEYHTTGA